MRKELQWTEHVSERFDIPASNVYTGAILENPKFPHLGIELPGNLYEITSSTLEQNSTIYTHFLIGNYLHLGRIFTEGALGLNKRDSKSLVVGMGLTGFAFAHFDLIDNDGNPIEEVTNKRDNDLDYLVVTENVPHPTLQTAVNTVVDELRGIYVLHLALQPVSWDESKWTNGVPKAKVIYERDGIGGKTVSVNPIEFGHVNSTSLQESVDRSLRYANPFHSNVIGAPLYLLLKDNEEKERHYIWQPVPFDSHLPNHEVNFTYPDEFDNNIRCMKQIPRALHFCYLAQAAAKYYKPKGRTVKPSESMIQISATAVDKYKHQVRENPSVTNACIERLEKCIARARMIVHNHQRDIVPGSHVFTNFPSPEEFFGRILDDIGWSEAVLEKSVDEFLSCDTAKI